MQASTPIDALKNMLRDDAPPLLIHGYGLGERIWQRVRDGARSAPMRLLGDDTMFVRGVEGVKVFYDNERIARHGAMPALVQETLFGHGSVHSLDGPQHRHRKTTFVDVAYDDAQVAPAGTPGRSRIAEQHPPDDRGRPFRGFRSEGAA